MALKRLLPAVLLSALLSVSFGAVRTWAAVVWPIEDAAVFVVTENLLSVVAVLIDQENIGCSGSIDYYQRVYDGGNYAWSELKYGNDFTWAAGPLYVIPGWLADDSNDDPMYGYAYDPAYWGLAYAFSFDRISVLDYGDGNPLKYYIGDNAGSNWNNQTSLTGGFSPQFDVFSMNIGGYSHDYNTGANNYGWDEHVIKDLKTKRTLHPNGNYYRDVTDTGLEVTTQYGLPRQKWSQTSWHSQDPSDRRYEFVKKRLFPTKPVCYLSTYGYWYGTDGTYDYWYGVVTASATKPPNPGPASTAAPATAPAVAWADVPKPPVAKK